MAKPSLQNASPQDQFHQLKAQIKQHILGQETLVERILIALLADGHLLVEGAPGLAKTKAIQSLSRYVDASFQRIQFTPDMLPADITGTEIFQPQTASFTFQSGPVFHNIILADEINRAPAKVQSALLEAMAERQVSIGKKTHELPSLFLVMATQNPIEQEGTFPLPEAQLDRFLLHVKVCYPDAEIEQSILRLVREEARLATYQEQPRSMPNKMTQETIVSARKEILSLYMADHVEQYLVQLVIASRNLGKYDASMQNWLEYGASPRATIALDRCARAHAWLHGRDYVSPDDILSVIHDVLRHRLLVSFTAQAEGIDADQVIQEIINHVPAI